MSSVDGLVSGLDTSTIIKQLMQIERLPQTLLNQRMTKEQKVADALGTLRTNVLAVRDLARDLRSPLLWQGLKATASSDHVSVAARSGQVTGSVQVRVERMATAAAIYSDTVPSLDTVIAPTGSVFTYRGGSPMGFDSIKGNGIPVGDLPITVTAPTKPAVLNGAALATPVTIGDGNDTLELTVDGVARSLTVAHGTYATADELRGALATAIAGTSGLAGKVTTAVDGGGLRLSTVREGSAASLAVTDGTAAASLGLDATDPAQGTDGMVEVGADRIATAITDSTPQAVLTLAAGTGSLEVTMAGPLRTGSITAEQRSFGTGTLRDVVATINRSDLGYTAAAVNVGSGYRLQLTAKETGAASTVDIDRSMFTGLGFTDLAQGRDAQLWVEGDNPYLVTSSTNTFTDLLPGVDLTVRRATGPTDAPTTISVETNRDQVADKVASLVTAINTALKGVKTGTAYDTATRTSGALSGSSAVRRVAQDLTRALTDPVTGGALASASQVGITLGRDGTISFDREAFLAKLDQDPAAVASLFAEANGATGPGVFDRLQDVADKATAFGTGYLTSARDAADQRITDYTRQIDAYEVRMEQREATLRRTYAALETALSGLSNQQNWLAGQLGSLTANNS